MAAPTQLIAEHQRLLDRAIELAGDDQLSRFLGEHPTIRDPALIEALCDRATQLVRVDVKQAGHVSRLAYELADQLGTSYLRARSRRSSANVLHVQGDSEGALVLYEEALALFEADGNELEAAITRSSALQALTYAGHHDRSAQWAEQARRVFEAENDLLRLGRLELNEGLIAFRQERFEQARQSMERAYDRLLAVGGPGDVAHCLRNLATIHIGLKNFAEAEDVYARARVYCEKADLPLLLGEVEYNIAYLYYLRGEYTTAIELYRATRERCEATGEVYHHALCDLDEAEMYLELNLIEETVRATDAAIRSFERMGMRYEAGKALTYLAIARIRQGKTILALGIFDQAREVFVEERTEAWLGLIDLYKAVALAREGRRFEAEGLVRAAKIVFAAAGLDSKVAACETLRARLRLEDGELAAARSLCQRALERLAELDLPSLEYQALYILGRIEEKAGNSTAALEAYEASHRQLARNRSNVHTDELKIPLIDTRLEVYESLVTLLGGAGPVHDAEAVLRYMELAKARNMVDLLASRAVALPTRKARSAQVERVRRLREELNWYYRRLDVREFTQEDSPADDIDELRTLTRGTENELAESLREVAAIDPEFAALQTATTDRVEEIREVLGPDVALIEFYGARDALYACVLDARSLDVVAVSLTSRVRDLYRRLNDQMLKFRLGDRHVARFEDNILSATKAILHDLYLELIEPLESRLDGIRQLVIVPHGFGHWLPFHAFHDGDRYLIDRFAVSYAPTATVYHRCRTAVPAGGSGSLLLGVPADAHAEARTLAAELPDSRLLLGAEASIAALREHGKGRRHIHLATTALFRGDNPMFSSIELADGRLSLFDLYGLDLDTDLVVLSGCSSDATSAAEGDEWLGLARGLLYAGSRSVVLSQWNASPEARTELFQGFYRRLRDATAPSDALRQAMCEIKDRREHPFYWASLALVGSPG